MMGYGQQYQAIMKMDATGLAEELNRLVQGVQPASPVHGELCRNHWNGVAKPLGGLGRLEDLVVQIGAVQRREDVDISKRCVAVFCADNGVVAEGISQSGQDVTAIIAKLLASDMASVSAMAKAARADVLPVDMGVNSDLDDMDNIRHYKIAMGTANLAKGPAMTERQTLQAILIGAMVAEECREKGYRLAAIGEGGIGNTTTSAAVAAALLGVSAEQTAGKGAGLSNDGLRHKIEVINGALAFHQPNGADVLDVLSKVGGFDLAAMTGFYLGCGKSAIPVVIDGVIACVAALCAVRLCPVVKETMLPSHMSAEPAAELMMQELGMVPILQGNFHLGEGTGAVALFPLLDMALAVYGQNTSFAEIGMEAYRPL